MTKKSKVFASILALAMTMGVGFAAGCGNSNEPENPNPGGGDKPLAGTYNAKIWVAEAATEFTKEQIADYNSSNTDGITINATVEAVGEGEAATQMITDVEAGADLFCFAQDQFARLVQASALSQLGQAAATFVKDNNAAGTVSAVTSGEKVYAYPLTADNGYFMYYDKSVITDESHLTSLESLIADCEAAGRYFSFELENSAWYNASFFFATGCTSEWTANDEGTFVKVVEDYYSPEGLVALKGMYKLLNSDAYLNASTVTGFSSATPSAIVVSGTWDYAKALEILGENLGVAELPSFTVDNSTYHLASFSGCKLMGVKPQTDAKKSAAMHKLAQYLTGEAAQTERFKELAWGPSNIEAAKAPEVQANPALVALLAQSQYAVPQGNYPNFFWDNAKVIATGAKESDGSDAALNAVLKTYYDAREAFMKAEAEDPRTAEQKRSFTVIGSMNEDGWKTDILMEEIESGVWKTKEAVTFVAGDQFKVRKGLRWTEAYGDTTTGSGNVEVTEAGSFYVQFTFATKEIKLIPAA